MSNPADLLELAAMWCDSTAKSEGNEAVAQLWRTRAKMLRNGYQPMLVTARPSSPTSESMESNNAAGQATGRSSYVSPDINRGTPEPAPAAPASPSEKLQPINCDRDAARWAREFNEVIVKNGSQPFDPGFLIGWFANAMMCGEDTYRWRLEAAPAETPSEAQAGGTPETDGLAQNLDGWYAADSGTFAVMREHARSLELRLAQARIDLTAALAREQALRDRLAPSIEYVEGTPVGYGEDEIDRLHAQLSAALARIRELEAAQSAMPPPSAAQRDAADAKDAARYRWLRARLPVTAVHCRGELAVSIVPLDEIEEIEDEYYRVEVDAVIDAAMRQSAPDQQ